MIYMFCTLHIQIDNSSAAAASLCIDAFLGYIYIASSDIVVCRKRIVGCVNDDVAGSKKKSGACACVRYACYVYI